MHAIFFMRGFFCVCVDGWVVCGAKGQKEKERERGGGGAGKMGAARVCVRACVCFCVCRAAHPCSAARGRAAVCKKRAPRPRRQTLWGQHARACARKSGARREEEGDGGWGAGWGGWVAHIVVVKRGASPRGANAGALSIRSYCYISASSASSSSSSSLALLSLSATPLGPLVTVQRRGAASLSAPPSAPPVQFYISACKASGAQSGGG